MKNKIILIALVWSIILLGGCSGDRTPQNGKDTVKNTYGVSKDTSKVDTSKMAGPDNGASGGSKLIEDTAKHDTAKK